MIRIILVDDQALIRQAIVRALGDIEDFQVAGQASSAEQALEFIAQDQPDVVLLDVSMPGMGGLAAAEVLRKSYPLVKVLFLTVHDREDYFFRALRSDASGYILKGAELDELVEAIRTVARGDLYIYPSMVPKLVTDYLQRVKAGEPEMGELKMLTPREQELLHFFAEGRSTAEIAGDLSISTHTVRRHRENIMEKLNFHSKAELIRFAIRHGFLKEST
jgi:two-component system response regulator NreC